MKGGKIMVTKKLKSILSLKGMTFADYARKLGILPQSLQTKSKSNAYKIKDLIEFADLTDTQLAFIDKDGKALITFDKDDIKKEPTPK